MNRLIPARQVHLDFHTSEHLRDVGGRFDRRQFQDALRVGRVNSINLFAKCHHSWSYYPTAVGRPHPHLARDLLGEQVDACREVGVACPIYYTVGWSANDAADHPDWCVRNRDGSLSTVLFDPDAKPEDRIPENAWVNLCPSGPYRELMLAQTDEICRRFAPVDGLWYDICNVRPCYCERCRAGMGDAASDAEAMAYATGKWASFLRACRDVVLGHRSGAVVFFNGITHSTSPRELLDCETRFELEDLPTSWGGYDKLPPRARFFERYDRSRPRVAMTGKFHTFWGEFGGFKHPDALRYEAAMMLAYGCACSVGDQLHPSGVMDPETYRTIGEAYAHVERAEAYGLPSEPTATLAIWPSLAGPAAHKPGQPTTPPAHDQGTAQALMERQIDFEVLDPEAADLDAVLPRFETIVLTGGACLTRPQAERLQRFVDAGGSLVVQHESLLDRESGEPLFDVGGRVAGPARYENDYVVAGPALARGGVVASPVLCYAAALRVELAGEGEVLARVREPFFDRRYKHYCSHQNTPNQLEDATHVAALRRGRIVYLAHPIGAMYQKHGARAHRDLLVNALRLVHRRPAVEATLPSAGRVTLLRQPHAGRYAAHLLYAPPMPRGRTLVIEDLPTLRDVPLTVRVPEPVRRARLPLDGDRELAVTRGDDGAVRVVVPEVRGGHQIVAFDL